MTRPIDFVIVFSGGPLDGRELLASRDAVFQIFVAEPLEERSGDQVAVYEYNGNREGVNSVLRLYRYFETMETKDAKQFIAAHGGDYGCERTR